MLTLLEAAKLQPNTLSSDVIEIFGRENGVLERMPFQDIAGSAITFNREGTLPGIAFRGVNESYTESTGVINPVTETLTICGGDSDYDKFLVASGVNNGNARAAHDAMKAKSLSLVWLDKFFNGNSATEPREFDGLATRLTGDQVLDGGPGGGVLTLASLDQLIDAVDGTPDALFMSKVLRRKVNGLIRAESQAIETVSDQFGRQLQAYAGIPIVTVGDDHEGNAILGFTEDDGEGNLDTASIYAVRFGLDGVHGIQTQPITAVDLGEIPSKAAFRTRLEWYSSYTIKHGKAAARLRYINA